MTLLRSGYTGIAKIGDGLVHVVSTPNGILICRGGPAITNNPYGPRGPFAGGGIVGQVGSDGSFRVTYASNFSPWAKIVYTPNGLVFWQLALSGVDKRVIAVGRIQPNGAFVQTYSGIVEFPIAEHEVIAVGNDLIFMRYATFASNIQFYSYLRSDLPRLDGAYRLGGISSSGQFALKSTLCSPALAGGYLVPTVIGNDVFLYVAEDGAFPFDSFFGFTNLKQSGWAMVASFGGSGYFYPDRSCRGKLIIKQEHPEGSFAAGWHNIVNTANGIFFHNPNNGSVMVGSLDVNGNFTETQNIPNWLDPGYSMVVNVTD